MTDSSLRFRPGRPDDVDRVFAWSNDPVTRAVSFQSDPIPYETHVGWYARQLETDGQNLFIVEDLEAGGEPVAIVRLNRIDEPPGACVIGINVSPQARGRGLGTRALVAATPVAAELGFEQVVALIRPDNVASLRAFEKAGYQRTDPTEVSGNPAERYVICP